MLEYFKKDAREGRIRQLDRGFEQDFEHFLDYLKSIIENQKEGHPYSLKKPDDKVTLKSEFKKIQNKKTFDKFKERVDEYFVEDGRRFEKRQTSEGVGEELVQELYDGFKVVRLLTEEAYRREGKNCSNCLQGGAYWDDDPGRRTEILSLRDRDNEPHATMAVSRNEDDLVMELQGKGNSMVNEKYFKYLYEFFDIKVERGRN